ncbi:hypothetical protein M0804_015506 [Polistes exclamans]|nr:hypothetical protein M0804_015508 [Polistes exclamans]KAI4473044.1 hypothetical protein M0804_015506 [Polistes exclamans]
MQLLRYATAALCNCAALGKSHVLRNEKLVDRCWVCVFACLLACFLFIARIHNTTEKFSVARNIIELGGTVSVVVFSRCSWYHLESYSFSIGMCCCCYTVAVAVAAVAARSNG